MSSSTYLMWFRSDLRISDNTALYEACNNGQVIAVYLLFPEQWQQHDDSPNKIKFQLAQLEDLKQALNELNIPLLIKKFHHFNEAAEFLLSTAKQYQCSGLFFNEEYGVNEINRDRQVHQAFHQAQLTCQSFTDQLLFTPGTIKNQSGNFYKVFTQFKRKLYEKLSVVNRLPLPTPAKQKKLNIKLTQDSLALDYCNKAITKLFDHWPIGETTAQQRLQLFINDKIVAYQENRDFPAQPATSQLSPYLTAGIISIRQCLHVARSANLGEFASGKSGITCWINELIWREFYKHILVGFPQVSKHQPFLAETQLIPWSNDSDLLKAWQQGKTGFPIVDAAMRQLVATGWMHNRLRMIVAMFLTKDLMLDWRLGEKFFMQHLVDGDLAANNGGWQWSASTGTDAAPYFRIFNPTNQSKKFDPQGQFIKQFVPELQQVPIKYIHQPQDYLQQNQLHNTYPIPIVDHSQARERVLSAFKQLKEAKSYLQ
ncbi:deoxyribodipyrimidine photo-lyase [Endozoicomonas sp. SM1973]|uniref:Deoxyribodipyrimidine photo-lyase n=1 Tax=Spartinivicinus marinus TaxID=2994442 RepID=A0A853IDX0_9GAMM|nr:deoxyribodipyrimidine photo-lyase [Spartinivicinus marinus]MCX4025015.1 deoxyribodipyrimidine photo-lyase [Spartinivicinus marinus]NYZ67707.1 deoxyribodipyrimidine photo-lyase [Spartinivicinus marinus]